MHAHDFQRQGPFWEAGGGGQLPSGTFLEIHSFWYPDPSLRLVELLKPSSKCVLFGFFSLQLLKKHTLNMKLLFCINHAQKALFKFPKICNINFWFENEPPPPPFGTFQKIHPIWNSHHSLSNKQAFKGAFHWKDNMWLSLAQSSCSINALTDYTRARWPGNVSIAVTCTVVCTLSLSGLTLK